MYGCESWTIKKADSQRIDAFKLWCWRRLDNPFDCKEIKPVNPKGNWSGIFIGRTDAESEAPILWPHVAKNWLIWKDPDAGKGWRWRRRGRQRMRWLMASLTHWTWVWASSGSWWWTGEPGMPQPIGSQIAGHDWATELTERENKQNNLRQSLKSFYKTVYIQHMTKLISFLICIISCENDYHSNTLGE